MRKRTVVKIISFLIAISVFLVGKCITYNNKMNYYKGVIGNSYEAAARELTSAVNEIDTELQKASYLNSSNALNKVSSKLLINCETAKSALAQLPSGNGEIKTLNMFLSQVGNYASYLAGKLALGEEISNEESEALFNLSNIASVINKTIESATADMGNAEYWITEIDNQLENKIDENSLSEVLIKKEELLEDYPVLVYDGPYSDVALNTESVYLKDQKEVNQNVAALVMERITNIPNEYFNYEGISDGRIKSHIFSGENISAAISVNGGYPVYYSNSRNVEESKLSSTQALEKGYKFLASLGEVSFSHTYYFEENNVCTINFAYVDGATLCYTDLVKIGVAMDNGEIVFIENTPYLTNHKTRTIETPLNSVEQAKEKLNKNLTVLSDRLVLIPLDGREVLCYEFICKGKNDENINVYINTNTLNEEQILLLIITDTGTLSK